MTGALWDRGSWTLDNCSVVNALDVIGNRISLLLIREALLGTSRFDDFAARIGISESAAAKRLTELTTAGVLERRPYRDPKQRERHEYLLTQKGSELRVIVTALRDWGDTWASGESGPPFHVIHRDCGSTVHAEVRCTRGHSVSRSEADLIAGPELDS
ncbi:transcriptional regulator [Rhodococcus sp. 06-462-5]|uniref:winged helix-turn-helix transcriptional regulator n=1 Tax=Nocardiaceae TaxID=85025 RepID=UPI0009B8449B|nr:transcriptional regulator [Rhodococcus sp. 06-462-5]OZE67962.1 transcriptional regulator [Rhodococcus sp. 02-925g]OZF52017.1 transcriptional regulator [Rhodococcus sp. 14-1411-2a]